MKGRKKGARGAIRDDELLANANEIAARLFRRSKRGFVLVTSLNIAHFPCSNIALNGCNVRPLKTRQRYPRPKALVDRHRELDAIESWQLVRVRTEGRTPGEAADRALEAVHLLRALWTLFDSRIAWSMSFEAPPRSAVGPIHVAPIHTLHEPNGAPLDMYWYEACPFSGPRIFRPRSDWLRLEKKRREAARRLSALPYRQDLVDLLGQYVYALDHVDRDVSSLHMWSVLEQVTRTGDRRYDETIKRAVWGLPDRESHREKLDVARSQRNRYVHRGISRDNAHSIVFLVKSYVDMHLIRLLRNDLGVGSLDEYGTCLDLPADKRCLLARRARIGRALRVLGQGA